jgi:hypothetical protein
MKRQKDPHDPTRSRAKNQPDRLKTKPARALRVTFKNGTFSAITFLLCVKSKNLIIQKSYLWVLFISHFIGILVQTCFFPPEIQDLGTLT